MDTILICESIYFAKEYGDLQNDTFHGYKNGRETT